MIYLFTLSENYYEFSGHYLYETDTQSLINIYNTSGYIIIDYKKRHIKFGEIINVSENYLESGLIPKNIKYIDGKPDRNSLDSEFLSILEKEMLSKILESI